jgi:riboflavin synthase
VFTGIVEEVGTLARVARAGNGLLIEVHADRVIDDLGPGDSVAVDGVCQTVTELRSQGFVVQAVATTLERTTFGDFASGRRVNLERSLRFGARVGGHLVQGHVDGVGKVESVTPREELVLIDFTLPEAVAEVAVLHGSIAFNGVSLTINALPREGVAQVSIIPYTWQNTGTIAKVDRSSLVTLDSGTLTIIDANGAQVYSAALTCCGTVETSAGTAGPWTIRVALTNSSGMAKFRVQRGG